MDDDTEVPDEGTPAVIIVPKLLQLAGTVNFTLEVNYLPETDPDRVGREFERQLERLIKYSFRGVYANGTAAPSVLVMASATPITRPVPSDLQDIEELDE